MRRSITLADVGSLLHSRAELCAHGCSERAIRTAVAAGDLHRVRRGWYATAREWDQLWPEGRHLLHVVAVSRDVRGDHHVFSHASAAALHGLPLYRFAPDRVHLRVANPRHICSVPDVHRHEGQVPFGDVTFVRGIRTTSLERTIVDLTRSVPLETAVAAADFALRAVAIEGNAENNQRAEVWRDAVHARIAADRGQRGIRQARWVAQFADGRAQLPGESVSRLQLFRLGVRNLDLQVNVPAPDGGNYWVDFGINDCNAFGEYDGESKYLDEGMRAGRTMEQVLLDEKRREDWIRGTTGRRVVRWGVREAASAAALAQHLRSCGIALPC